MHHQCEFRNRKKISSRFRHPLNKIAEFQLIYWLNCFDFFWFAILLFALLAKISLIARYSAPLRLAKKKNLYFWYVVQIECIQFSFNNDNESSIIKMVRDLWHAWVCACFLFKVHAFVWNYVANNAKWIQKNRLPLFSFSF